MLAGHTWSSAHPAGQSLRHRRGHRGWGRVAGMRVMRGSHKLRGAGAFVLEELSQVQSREGLQGGRTEGTGPRDPPGEEGWAQALPRVPPLSPCVLPSIRLSFSTAEPSLYSL